MKFLFAIFLLTLFLSIFPQAQHFQTYERMNSRVIKTLSQQQIDDLTSGRCMGLALAAELNGYPGPFACIGVV